ncbi:MAG: F0F1 ATP synthase subunit B [Fimbriimonadales bacterium]|nr:F0F1 ATP synthase subunit B [Fimbriimonadales bacterium]
MSTPNATTPSGSPAAALVRTVIGLAMMAGGFYLSQHAEEIPFLAFQKALGEKGVPLDLGITTATIGVFLVLLPIIRVFYIKPLEEAILERNTQLERTFSEAEELRAEMARLRSEYEERIAQTEAEARAQIQQQIREAQQMRQQLMAEAAERAEELLARAREDIERERQKVLAELQLRVVDLSLSAAEKVVGASLDDEQNRRLVTEFIQKVEAAG